MPFSPLTQICFQFLYYNSLTISAYDVRMFIRTFMIVVLTLSAVYNPEAAAHGGRTAADGCHNDRKNGGRHCHGGGTTPPQPARPTGTRDYYANCTAARAAGPTPIYRGQRGYGRHLDRDGDGIACE